MRNVSVTRQISNWFAGSIAMVAIILIPLFFVALEIRYVKGSLNAEVIINSHIITGIINANPEMWQYEQMQLEEILSRRLEGGNKEIQRILDNRNNLIAESADELSPPLLKISHDLKESGVTVGKIEIYRSWRPLLWYAFYLFIVGVLIAAIIFIAISVLPFHALIRAEEALRKKEESFRALFEQASIGVAEVDTKTGRFIRINQKYCDIAGYALDEMMAMTYLQITHPDDLPTDLDYVRKIGEGEIRVYSREKRYVRKDGAIVWVNLTVSPIWEKEEQSNHQIAVVEDITERKRVEEERNQLILKLKQALAEVRTLSGLLPICSHCKKIRDDNGYWNQIESYIHKHSGTEFSHSICPECAEKYYPEMDLYEDSKRDIDELSQKRDINHKD